MLDSQSSYRQIIKATSIFGGVQLVTILISLVRSKVIAILIGPMGIGIVGLMNSALTLVSSLTNIGLESSAVKTISAINNDEAKLSKEVSILNRLIWFSGTLGTLIVIIFSTWLSNITFGNSKYTIVFILASITLLLKQLTSGKLGVLQGLQKLDYLAKANLHGNIFGLLITLPLYYFWKIDAIVPALVCSSLIAFLFSAFYVAKINIPISKISNKEMFSEGKSMIKLGISLSVIGLLTTVASYLLQIFISNTNGVVDVGLYNAGFTIINSYVGVVFIAMATDYYPRLSKVCDDIAMVKNIVTQQAIIAILVITPIIVLFLTLAPNIIQILYSKKFVPIENMVCWGILGMVFKAVSWAMGYILIAKGDSKMFIKTSIGFNSLFLIINLIGYHYYGLQGLGITFTINYILHFLVLKIITFRRYDFHFDFVLINI